MQPGLPHTRCCVIFMQQGLGWRCVGSEAALLLYTRDCNVLLQVNTEIVNCQKVASRAGQKQLQNLIQSHVSATGSRLGQSLLDSWEVDPQPCQ